ncbi:MULTISPECIES: hypothetical protein [unclassified Streptomyces]|uniref:hypothetical protein n=1 Tax=unclassified Streptomyces TaxID=2593676 RepID=UPI0023654CA0|nr:MULTISPECIES: hypothetical protein [unclassified Streptomyces]MDF3140292.1 hypothetical protein [Streptomyces sp. T21Q-yed]WDF44121.1 hypothetical protein PBV52_48775 [Streptomyces sp. T12]
MNEPFVMFSDQGKYPITPGLDTSPSKGVGDTDLFPLVGLGSAVSVLPLIALVLSLRRLWRAVPARGSGARGPARGLKG